jgi:hypothetical protein
MFNNLNWRLNVDFVIALEAVADNVYQAVFASGATVELAASNYADAVCELGTLGAVAC